VADFFDDAPDIPAARWLSRDILGWLPGHGLPEPAVEGQMRRQRDIAAGIRTTATEMVASGSSGSNILPNQAQCVFKATFGPLALATTCCCRQLRSSRNFRLP
jgi:hypothetical protein